MLLLVMKMVIAASCIAIWDMQAPRVRGAMWLQLGRLKPEFGPKRPWPASSLTTLPYFTCCRQNHTLLPSQSNLTQPQPLDKRINEILTVEYVAFSIHISWFLPKKGMREVFYGLAFPRINSWVWFVAELGLISNVWTHLRLAPAFIAAPRKQINPWLLHLRFSNVFFQIAKHIFLNCTQYLSKLQYMY